MALSWTVFIITEYYRLLGGLPPPQNYFHFIWINPNIGINQAGNLHIIAYNELSSGVHYRMDAGRGEKPKG